MKYPLFVLLLSAAFAGSVGCRKYKTVRDDATGGSSIYGRLFLADTLLGTGAPVPLGKQVVFLSYPHDSTVAGNFLLTAKTDSAGYFLFNNLQTDSGYRLLFSDTVNGLVYLADTLVNRAGDDSLPLIARPALDHSTGFKYSFVDRANGGAIPGVHACVFTSSTLALAAGSDTCAGANFQLSSDNQGRASLYGILPGQYYVFIYTSYTALPVKKLESITISPDVPEIIYDSLP